MVNFKNLKGNAFLLLAAIVWGFAFVAQDIAAGLLSAFSILSVRSFIGAFALIPVAFFTSKKSGTSFIPKEKNDIKRLLIAGVICGLCLCVASSFQQIAMGMYPNKAAVPARSGFITALYVVLVPVFGVFLKKKLSFNMCIGIILAVAGLYLLCVSDGFKNIYVGDLVMLACAFCFTIHIICIDTVGAGLDGVKLSCIQFFTCAVASLVLAVAFERPSMSDFYNALPALLYLGVFSSGIGYTCQIIGQHYSENSAVASIVMSLESVFAAIGGAMFGDKLNDREKIGCVIMFAAIVISQLPTLSFKKIKK